MKSSVQWTPIVVMTAKEITEEDRVRLNGAVEILLTKDNLRQKSWKALSSGYFATGTRKAKTCCSKRKWRECDNEFTSVTAFMNARFVTNLNRLSIIICRTCH